MKVFRRWYWIGAGFVKKYLLGLVIGTVVGVLVVINAPKIVKALPISHTQRIGRIGAITPQNIPLDILQQVSSGLTSFSPTGEVIPDIAQTVSLSDDKLTYTLTLKPNTYWSSGDKLIASDLEFQLPDVQTEVVNDETIVFKLKEPYSPFTSILSQPILKKASVGRLTKSTQIIGLKDFRIADIQTHNQIITTLTLTAPGQTIKYFFYPTENEAVTAFKLGLIDSIEQLTTPYLEDWPNVGIKSESQSSRYLAVFYNTADPSLQEKSLRQMLTYAIDKPDDNQRVISPISKDSWAYNPQVKPYQYNLATAKEMYQKQKEANPNLNLSLELTTTPAYTTLAQEIVQKWRDLGINATLKIVSFPDPNEYQALLIGQQIPQDPDQYALWHSTQSSNITHYQNPKIDKLLEDGRKEHNQEKRKLIYQDFQRFLVEDSPAAFLYNLKTYSLTRL